MHRIRILVLAAVAAVGVAGAAAAQDVTAVRPSRPQPKVDMSRSVTLTGAEIEAYTRATAAATEARLAAQAAEPVYAKIRDALAVPASPERAE